MLPACRVIVPPHQGNRPPLQRAAVGDRDVACSAAGVTTWEAANCAESSRSLATPPDNTYFAAAVADESLRGYAWPPTVFERTRADDQTTLATPPATHRNTAAPDDLLQRPCHLVPRPAQLPEETLCSLATPPDETSLAPEINALLAVPNTVGTRRLAAWPPRAMPPCRDVSAVAGVEFVAWPCADSTFIGSPM